MKPLSIEELKSLADYDWVWIVEKKTNKGTYMQICRWFDKDERIAMSSVGNEQCDFSIYGKTWLAYKNKEQAECKGELVEFVCNIGDKVYIVNKDNTYRPIDEGIIDNIIIYDKNIIYEWTSYDYACETIELWDEGEFTDNDLGKSVFLDYEQAEQKLKELRGKE